MSSRWYFGSISVDHPHLLLCVPDSFSSHQFSSLANTVMNHPGFGAVFVAYKAVTTTFKLRGMLTNEPT